MQTLLLHRGRTWLSTVRSARARRARPAPALTALALAAAPFLVALPAAGATVRAASLTNPPANVDRPASMNQACAQGENSGCESAVLQAIDSARALEGVGPMTLPADYATLTEPEQLLVVADRERVDRGLPGFVGLSPDLNADAQAGANADNDPVGPANTDWGSNWAGGEADVLMADFDWMYNDGAGSDNIDCTSASASGCWDHRENVLGNYGATPSMGAAIATVDGHSSLTELFSSEAASNVTPINASDPTPPAPAPTTPAAPSGATSDVSAVSVGGEPGYLVLRRSGAVQAFGAAKNLGQPGVGSAPAVAIAATPDGQGYWIATSNGAVFAFGDAGNFGSAAGTALAAPIVAMAATPDGQGYWLAASDGGVFAFGDAGFHGSTGALRLAAPVVGIAATPDGQGYWLVARDGGVFAFNAPFIGSMGGKRLAKPVTGMTTSPTGDGYRLVATDGGIFSFGAPFYGSLGATPPPRSVAAMAPTADGHGYYLLDQAGEIYAFGDAAYLGNA
jgi:hypothetical protein